MINHEDYRALEQTNTALIKKLEKALAGPTKAEMAKAENMYLDRSMSAGDAFRQAFVEFLKGRRGV